MGGETTPTKALGTRKLDRGRGGQRQRMWRCVLQDSFRSGVLYRDTSRNRVNVAARCG